MDKTPPLGRKPKDLPFYKAPENVRTSSQIIKDAKDSVQRAQLRALVTRRPETPQEGQRQLFGEQSIRDPISRPPSAFSLGSHHFDSESRPVSGTRLPPLEHKPRQVDEIGPIAPKPPADPNRPIRRPSSRQRLHQQHSIDSTIDGTTDKQIRHKSGSLTDVSLTSPTGSIPGTPEIPRRVHSGPKERTKHIEDGTDVSVDSGTPPRADSGKRRRSKERRDTENCSHNDSHRVGSGGTQRASSAGKPGSAGRREEETPEESLLYNKKIGPIIDEMQKHIKEKDPERLSELSLECYQGLKEANLLGKNCKRRGLILKTVFKLLDLESPKLLLRLARLILALKVSGNNLVNVCKLVFKVSKDEKNDDYFVEGNILDLMIDMLQTPDVMGTAEALIYCVGALKFLSLNETIIKQFVEKDFLVKLARLLVTLNKMTVETGRPSEQVGHILVQLTGTVRNLSNNGRMRSQILALNMIDELCKVAELHQMDGDLMFNLARVFSKLTAQQNCCEVFGKKASHYRSFINILDRFYKREDLVVRICFMFGNLTLRHNELRQKLFDQPKAYDTLLLVLKYYCQQDLKIHQAGNINGKASSHATVNKVDDVLIKVIRVFANLSINEKIGTVLAGYGQCVDLLIDLLDRKNMQTNEELVLTCMATINNLSYYTVSNSGILQRQIKLAKCLMKYLDHKHMEGLSEASRIYGNLSREKEIRDFIAQRKVDELMVSLLDSGDREVVFSAVGVLINVMADDDKRATLKIHGGVKKLIDVLRDFSHGDWNLASMVCKTLWNYSGKITSTNACFGEEEGQELIDLLTGYLVDETPIEGELGDLWQFHHDVWETEFCPVATQLLRRIEEHQSNFVPLDHPS